MSRRLPFLSALVPGVIFAALASGIGLAAGAMLVLQSDSRIGLAGDLEAYDRLRAVVAFEPDLSRMESSKSLLVYEDALLGSGTPAEVSARLLALLNQMAADRGLQILRTSDLPPVRSGAVTLIGTELELIGQTAQIYGMLRQIEMTKPFLSVDRLSLRAEASVSAEELQDSAIAAALRVYGATHTSAKTPPPPSP